MPLDGRGLLESEEVSLLFRAFRNGGRGCRVNRKDADKVKISRIIEVAMGSMRACSLRVCSLLLRVVAKTYEAKVRICLFEIRSLVKILDGKKREGPWRRKERNMLSMDTGLVSNGYSSEFNDTHHTDSLMLSYSEALDPADILQCSPRRRCRNVFDKVMVLSTSGMIIPDTSRGGKEMEALEPAKEEAFVIREARRTIPDAQSIEVEYSEVSTFGSVERGRSSSVYSTRYDFSDPISDEGILDLSHSILDFDEHAVGSRQRRARIFYRILELSSRGCVIPIQKQAYGKIVLIRADWPGDGF
ncbi:hypothetical protein M970_080990 [Encephalitozoon cuniculi EcunIII-L]|nr:hypothetical protein M970_080990 [Encephalitozoon cuniculi EcunIII-L]